MSLPDARQLEHRYDKGCRSLRFNFPHTKKKTGICPCPWTVLLKISYALKLLVHAYHKTLWHDTCFFALAHQVLFHKHWNCLAMAGAKTGYATLDILGLHIFPSFGQFHFRMPRSGDLYVFCQRWSRHFSFSACCIHALSSQLPGIFTFNNWKTHAVSVTGRWTLPNSGL